MRANAGTESLRTVEQLIYSPGYTGEIGVAIQIPELPTGDQVVRWGYFGPSDGVRFGVDAAGFFIQDIRDGTIDQTVRRDDWNGDTAENAILQALQDGVISRQELSLYNFGSVGHEFLIRDEDGRLTPNDIHTFNADGSDETDASNTTLSRQNNPISVVVENPASEDFDVFVADRQATIRGQFLAEDRPQSHEQFDVDLNGETWVPVLSFRIKDDYDEIGVDFVDFQTFASENAAVQFRTDAGSTDTADYQPPSQTDPNETAVEVDPTPTASVTDGFKRFTRLIPGGGSQGNAAGQLADIGGVDLTVKRGRPVTVFVRLTDGTGGTLEACNTSWTETW